MYALRTSAEGACYLCVPPNSGIESAALGVGEAAALGAGASPAPGAGKAAAIGASKSTAPGAGESAFSGIAPAAALHTFTLHSGASRSFFRNCTTITPLSRPISVSLADPSRGPVLAHSSTVLPCPAVPSGSLSGLHLPSFSTNLVAVLGKVFAAASRSGPESAPCSCLTRLSSGTTALVTPPCLVFQAWPPVSLSLVFPGLSLPFPRGLPLPAFLASRGGNAPLLTPPSSLR
ncbi:unnamed protein product [Closterium sp. NIES-65]|nr:unnamed protein product [Closterium sp. NIES-65]